MLKGKDLLSFLLYLQSKRENFKRNFVINSINKNILNYMDLIIKNLEFTVK